MVAMLMSNQQSVEALCFDTYGITSIKSRVLPLSTRIELPLLPLARRQIFIVHLLP